MSSGEYRELLHRWSRAAALVFSKTVSLKFTDKGRYNCSLISFAKLSKIILVE